MKIQTLNDSGGIESIPEQFLGKFSQMPLLIIKFELLELSIGFTRPSLLALCESVQVLDSEIPNRSVLAPGRIL